MDLAFLWLFDLVECSRSYLENAKKILRPLRKWNASVVMLFQQIWRSRTIEHLCGIFRGGPYPTKNIYKITLWQTMRKNDVCLLTIPLFHIGLNHLPCLTAAARYSNLDKNRLLHWIFPPISRQWSGYNRKMRSSRAQWEIRIQSSNCHFVYKRPITFHCVTHFPFLSVNGVEEGEELMLTRHIETLVHSP